MHLTSLMTKLTTNKCQYIGCIMNLCKAYDNISHAKPQITRTTSVEQIESRTRHKVTMATQIGGLKCVMEREGMHISGTGAAWELMLI